MYEAKKHPILSAAVYFGFWLLTVLYFEAVLHFVTYGSFNWKFLYIFGFSVTIAGILTLVMSVLPRKAGFPVAVVLLVLLMVLYGSQLIYKFIFGTLYSVAQIQQGGAASPPSGRKRSPRSRIGSGISCCCFCPWPG